MKRKSTSTTTNTSSRARGPRGIVLPRHDEQVYATFLKKLQLTFETSISEGVAGIRPLFTTDATNLWETFLANLPAHLQQEYTCFNCRSFVRRYGHLVTILDSGATVSAIWEEADVPELYRDAVAAVAERVHNAKVTGVFYSRKDEWGHSITGVEYAGETVYPHMAVTPPGTIYRPKLQIHSAEQAMAEKLQNYRTLCPVLAGLPLEVIDEAIRILQAGSLPKADKYLGWAQWVRQVHQVRQTKHTHVRDNLTWLAVAKAPAGFCSISSSSLGFLLEDVAAGKSFAAIERHWQERVGDPLQHQRPQAPPSEGNKAQAEKIVAQMGLAPSLHRRYARLEDITLLWRPKPADVTPAQPGQVFAAVETKQRQPKVQPVQLPAQTMTWVKFRDTVLPTAERIEAYVGYQETFGALMTAVYPDAPPIIQWDYPEARNPVSWYTYREPSPASQWGLPSRVWVPVTGICLQPNLWGPRPQEHVGKALFLLLQHAKDTNTRVGMGLYPEVLRSDLHACRSTIEAFSNQGRPAGRDEATACGLRLQGDTSWSVRVKVTSAGQQREIKLDRWD